MDRILASYNLKSKNSIFAHIETIERIAPKKKGESASRIAVIRHPKIIDATPSTIDTVYRQYFLRFFITFLFDIGEPISSFIGDVVFRRSRTPICKRCVVERFLFI